MGLSPCARCGCVPVDRKVDAMAMIKCIRSGVNCCRSYVYGDSLDEARARWNEANPLATPTTPPSRDAPSKEKL